MLVQLRFRGLEPPAKTTAEHHTGVRSGAQPARPTGPLPSAPEGLNAGCVLKVDVRMMQGREILAAV